MSTLQRVGSQDHLTAEAQVRPETMNSGGQQLHVVLRLQPRNVAGDQEQVRGQPLNPALAAAMMPLPDGSDAPQGNPEEDVVPATNDSLASAVVWSVLLPVCVGVIKATPVVVSKVAEYAVKFFQFAYPIGVTIVEKTPGWAAQFSEAAYPVCVALKGQAMEGWDALNRQSQLLYQAATVNVPKPGDPDPYVLAGTDGWTPNMLPWDHSFNVELRRRNPNSPFRNGRPIE